MKVLVTGANGFIGNHLIPALIDSGHSVVAAARHPTKRHLGVEWFQIPDLREPYDWSPFPRDIDVVIHLAGVAHAPRTKSIDMTRVNYEATERLATAAACAGVKQFIFVSSIAAQTGPSSSSALREHDEPVPTTSYGRSKLAAENAVKSSGVTFTILRPVAVSGDDAKGNFQTLRKLANLRLPLPFGGLRAPRSIVTIENMISAILFAIGNAKCHGETFVVSDSVTNVAALIGEMRTRAGRSEDLFYVPDALIRWPLQMIGAWPKVGQPLIANSAKLRSLGWPSCSSVSSTRAPAPQVAMASAPPQ